MNGGLYDADDNLVTDWATLVNTYSMDVEKDYTSSTYETDTMSPYYVLTNNPELSAGVKIKISDTITSIGSRAFYRCSGLMSLNLGSGVTSIGMDAFASCSGLTSITILSIEPPTLGSSALTGTSALTAIYVPDESVEAYKVADGWSDYADLIKPISEKPAE